MEISDRSVGAEKIEKIREFEPRPTPQNQRVVIKDKVVSKAIRVHRKTEEDQRRRQVMYRPHSRGGGPFEVGLRGLRFAFPFVVA